MGSALISPFSHTHLAYFRQQFLASPTRHERWLRPSRTLGLNSPFAAETIVVQPSSRSGILLQARVKNTSIECCLLRRDPYGPTTPFSLCVFECSFCFALFVLFCGYSGFPLPFAALREIFFVFIRVHSPRMSSHKRVICFQYWNGESLQRTRSKKDLAGSVCPFSLRRPAYLVLELPHRANMAFCLLKVKRRIAILQLRRFNIDIDQLTLSERVLTDQSNDA
jgi:hypothetical protein